MSHPIIRLRGFTLIEMMIVVAIMGIFATMAVPSYMDRVIRSQVAEGIGLAEFVKQSIAGQYAAGRGFPKDNAAAGLPPAEKIVGNYVTEIAVRSGTIVITFGSLSNKFLVGKKLSLRPAMVDGYPQVPVAWVCGLAKVPDKMKVVGKDETTLPGQHLPIDCRPG